MSTPRKGSGTTLSRGGVSVAEVVNCTPGNDSAETSETTHLTSDAKTFLGPGVEDGGEWTFLVNFDPQETSHQNVRADLKAGTPQTWKVTFSDSSYRECSGIVTGFQVQQITPQNHLQAQVTIKISGVVTESP